MDTRSAQNGARAVAGLRRDVRNRGAHLDLRFESDPRALAADVNIDGLLPVSTSHRATLVAPFQLT